MEGIRTFVKVAMTPISSFLRSQSSLFFGEPRVCSKLFWQEMKHMSPRIVNCPYCGRILPKEFWHENSPLAKVVAKCPRCGSLRTWKDAKKLHFKRGHTALLLPRLRAQVFKAVGVLMSLLKGIFRGKCLIVGK